MKKIFKQFYPYIFVVLAIIFPWFLKPGYLFFTDFVLGPKITLAWQSNQFLLNLLFKLFSFVLPVAVVEKLFFGTVLLLILLAGKFLLNQLLVFFGGDKDKNNAGLIFILSLFFLFNPFVYDRVMYGQWGIVLGFAFFVFTIGYLFKFINEPIGRSLVFAWLFMGLSFLSAPHFIFFLVPFFILFYFLYFKNKINLSKIVKYSIIGILIFFILNINWLLAAFLSNSQSGTFNQVENFNIEHYEAFKTSGNSTLAVFKNVIMMSGFWGKDQLRYLDLTKVDNNWGRSFVLLLPLIIYGIVISLKEKRIRDLSIGLLIIWLMSIFLAAGMSTPPTKVASVWLFDNIPFYKGIRETQKWVAPVVLIYGFYLCYAVWRLFSKKFFEHYKMLLGIFLAGVIVMQASLLLWGLNRQVQPVNYPEDWENVNQLITQDSACQQKILFFPWHLYMHFAWVGKIIANPASYFFDCPIIRGTNMEWGGIYESINKETTEIDSWVMESNDNLYNILKNQDVGFIVLAKEVDYQKYLPRLREQIKIGLLSVYSDTETLLVYKVNDSL